MAYDRFVASLITTFDSASGDFLESDDDDLNSGGWANFCELGSIAVEAPSVLTMSDNVTKFRSGYLFYCANCKTSFPLLAGDLPDSDAKDELKLSAASIDSRMVLCAGCSKASGCKFVDTKVERGGTTAPIGFWCGELTLLLSMESALREMFILTTLVNYFMWMRVGVARLAIIAQSQST